MRAYERLLRYAAVHTTSDPASGTHPSAARELKLAALLADELAALGCVGVRVTDKGYVTAEIAPSPGYEDSVRMGFLAHMDTSPDFAGEGVHPQLIEEYDGGEVALGESGRVLSPAVFPHLTKLRGRTLITTDGTTLLGADDKAGIAEIMTMCERLAAGQIPHGKILIGFTPDEEIGEGADFFDVASFGADFAYTVDGGEEGSLEYENFNAAGAHFEVRGINVHPGSAKDIMRNASLVAMEINSLLPGADIPACTEGYEGFFHLCGMNGCVEHAALDYIVRDHDAASFEARKKLLGHIEKTLNEKYGAGTVTLTLHEQYRNMEEQIRPHRHLVDNAILAAARCGIEANVEPIRGGTDGARLSYMGLPCPNLGTGGYAFHGPFEHITAEGMDTQTEILLELVRIYAAEKR
ncbi:MAG: peptidase T [Eubacteriales bacterium]